jgi:membrane protease YdiL (CAAX protease family)
METLFLALLLLLIFSFFSQSIQLRLRLWLRARAGRVWLLPVALSALFWAAAAWKGAAHPLLLAAILAYTAAPVACAALQGPGPAARPTALDFATLLLFWLPLEFPGAVGAVVPRAAWGFLHSVAYGIAMLLGLALFAGYRALDGMKMRLPQSRRDLGFALAGFAVLAPILIPLGIAIGFLPAGHLPTAAAGRMAVGFAIIFVATALPEEILFRSLIQNAMMRRFGAGGRTLLVASVIFGLAHLDNGPFPPPNWRYGILATIAGFVYGKVFERSSTVLASVLLHAMVDWAKHFWF